MAWLCRYLLNYSGRYNHVMTTQIAKTVAGIYVFEDGDCIDAAQFPDDVEGIMEHLDETHPLENEYTDAEYTVLSAAEIADQEDMMVDAVRNLQRSVAQQIAEEKIRDAGSRDQLLVQAVRALDDLNELNNEMSERLRPWYSLHFPELEAQVSDNEELARIVSEHAQRDSVDGYEDLAENSTGLPIDEADTQILQQFAAQLRDGYERREELEEYVDSVAHEVAPNLTALLGGLLAARIISLAGSLEELAKMPASTIQVLGAEKAMFRHMRGEGEAPKHGALFMHPFVQQVPNSDRGEMARVLANKAAIASRIDQYGGEFKGESLYSEVEDRFDEIRA